MKFCYGKAKISRLFGLQSWFTFMKQHIQKYFAIKRKNNQGVFWNDAFKDTRLSAQSAASNKSSWNKKLLLEVEKGRRAEKMGEDAYAGPLSFWELPCLYYIPSVSCYSSLPVSARGGLTRKKVRRRRGPGGNTRSQKIYFTPSTARFSGKNNAQRRRKDGAR